jgi:2-aminobenzoate-CoA ligase
MSLPTAHLDTFAADHLPRPEDLPEFVFDGPDLQFPTHLNAARELLDARIAAGDGDRVCLRTPDSERWTYAALQDRADRIAQVLVEDLGVVPGNRVLLRGANTPMLVACWFGVVKAGAIAVATMPLLRARELGVILEKARIGVALCQQDLRDELDAAAREHPVLRRTLAFTVGTSEAGGSLDLAMDAKPGGFQAVDTAATDTCLIAFTSGTTGAPKATMHFHRDVMAACVCWPRQVLRATRDDVFIGSPPLAFTFGLGGLVLFPMHIGASTVLVDKPSPPHLLHAIQATGATVLFTAPTSYRAMAEAARQQRVGVAHGGTLARCVSAGEVLPAATRALWKDATGLELIDGIGSTELLHIFISADEAHARPGATGTVVPGYRACVVDEQLQPVPPGTVGRLAVKGPTGCKYLDDARQRQYVQGGWNLTGDAYRMDVEGYFHFQSRTDDLIVSAGYNIGAPEVEEALLTHPAVAECAIVGWPDAERGEIVKAFVVLRAGHADDADTARLLQEHVKSTIAPYKYPRAIEFRTALPRTETGKLQRFRLRAGPAVPSPAPPAAALASQPPRLAAASPHRTLLPAGWPRPKGYANGVAASGRTVVIAGMIGWDAQGVFHTDDFAAQARQALEHIVAVLAEAGGSPAHLVRMTWYVTDKRDYLAAAPAIGRAFRELIGHYAVAMTAVEVRALIEDRAKVEIEATAVIPEV